MRVAPCVLDILWRQRPLPPVSSLVLFVELDVADLQNQVGQGETSREAQGPGRQASVKHVHQVDGEVPLEPQDVTVRTMQHLHYAGVREDLIQQVHLLKDVEGVDDKVFGPRGDLYQTHKASVGPEVVMLNVHRNLFPSAGGLDFLDHLPQVPLGPDQHEGGVLHTRVVLRLLRHEEIVGPRDRVELLLVGVRQGRRLLPPVQAQGAEVREEGAGLLHGLAARGLHVDGAAGALAGPRAEAALALRLDEPRVQGHLLVVLHQKPGHELRALVVDQLAPPNLRLRYGGLAASVPSAASGRCTPSTSR
mmetsp:Transcript_26839/g.85261  ORF Transcript_26839/g.85261 Transcript_26839/m.85261 type:complete len:306 (-) Transcript_26839:653-1570(-)